MYALKIIGWKEMLRGLSNRSITPEAMEVKADFLYKLVKDTWLYH